MKKGDALTIVQPEQLVLIECHFASTADYFLAGAYRLLFNDEGVLWLKGYHTPNEECVNAARTCQALRQKEQEQEQEHRTSLLNPFGSPFLLPQPQPAPPLPGPMGLPPLPPGNYSIIVSATNTKGLL